MLLETKIIYWKNRTKIKWAKLGSEKTKFFHTAATQNYKGNYIATIKTDDDRILSNHDAKAAIIWHSFKDRMGQNDSPTMMFNLSEIIPINHEIDFAALEEPFSPEEIDNIVKEMPLDKSPGPNGFNGTFLKNVGAVLKIYFIDCAQIFMKAY